MCILAEVAPEPRRRRAPCGSSAADRAQRTREVDGDDGVAHGDGDGDGARTGTGTGTALSVCARSSASIAIRERRG